MSSIRIIGRMTTLAAMAVILILFAGPGCVKPSSAGSTSGDSEGKLNNLDMSIAKVGDSDIPLKDLLKSAQVIWALHQTIILPAVFEQEARKRGVYPSQEKLDEFLNNTLKMQGGMAAALSQIPPDVPRNIAMDEIRRQYYSQVVKQALLDDEYIKEHGAPTDAELQETWSTSRDEITGALGAQLGIPKEQVTMEQARTKLEDQIKQQWLGPNAQKFLKSLVDNYKIENYIVDAFSTAMPEEVVVPQMPLSVGGPERLMPPGARPSAPPSAPPGAPPGHSGR